MIFFLQLDSAFSDAFSPLLPKSTGTFAEFCSRHAAVMVPAEEQLRQGHLTAENLKDVVLKLIEIEKAAAASTADQSRDPRLRGKGGVPATAAAASTAAAAPHVVDYGHGRRSPGDVKGRFREDIGCNN